MDSLFKEVNNYLVHYFNNFALHIDYDLKSMSFDYGTKGKGAWKIEQDLRLKISIGSSSIKGFTEGLNEARLSATYDRSWYCLARNFLTNHHGNRWKFINLYSLPKTDNGLSFFVPIMTVGTSAYNRAKEYLHGQRPVDLPAAANYFRK